MWRRCKTALPSWLLGGAAGALTFFLLTGGLLLFTEGFRNFEAFFNSSPFDLHRTTFAHVLARVLLIPGAPFVPFSYQLTQSDHLSFVFASLPWAFIGGLISSGSLRWKSAGLFTLALLIAGVAWLSSAIVILSWLT